MAEWGCGMSWRKNRMELMAAKKHVRHSSHTDDIERLKADMAEYLAKGGKVKPATLSPCLTITEQQRKVKI